MRNQANRLSFLASLAQLVEDYQLDGVDYNWEYPKDTREWKGLFQLIKDTRTFADHAKLPNFQITMAYCERFPRPQQAFP